MTQEELLKQIRVILNELPFGEIGYRYKQTAFDACVKTAEWLQEQMMKDAIDARIIAIGQNAVVKEENEDDFRKCLSKFQDGDKVKVIIIKE